MTKRRILWLLAGVAAAHAAVSWLAGRRLASRLTSPRGLAPAPGRHEAFLDELRAAVPVAERLRFTGAWTSPVPLYAFFASPGDPAARPTLLFLHGKGGDATEWTPDVRRALDLGYNALAPDLRGHGGSGGYFFTYGLLEKEDLEHALEACREKFGLDPSRLGVHACSAGAVVALELAARHPEIRALWIESPYSDPRAMARRYLSAATGLPEPLLGLTARWAVRHAVAGIRRDLGASRSREGLERIDPVRSAGSVRMPAFLVYGARDRLVPPRFVRRLAEALPVGSVVWEAPGAGHCHHDDEAQKVARDEYVRRWTEFFGSHLPAIPA